MKNILLLLIVLFITFVLYSCGTMMGSSASEESRKFERIIEAPNVTKSDLYIRANSWFVENFTSAESVIEFQDKDAGKIMGKYTLDYAEGLYTYRVRQTISIDLKDEKVRLMIYDPYFKATSAMGDPMSSNYAPLKTQKGIDTVKEKWNNLYDSLVKSLNTNSNC